MRNNTLEINVTSRCNANFPLPYGTYFDIFIFVLSVLTLTAGVISWTFIKKFRWFKNYILLSIIFNNSTNAAIRIINVKCYFDNETNMQAVFIIYYFLYMLFESTVYYWFLILCYVFYLDLAKVFNNHISRRYLKANLFGWALPMILTIVHFTMKYITRKDELIYELPKLLTGIYIPLLLNLIFYLIVVFALLKRKANNVERRRCLLLLTVLLCLSGLFMLTIALCRLMDNGYLEKSVAFIILSQLQDLFPIVYVFAVDYNWSVWKDYYWKIIKRRRDHECLDNVTRSSIDQI